MEWWSNMIFPIRRVCGRVPSSLGFRKSGIPKLRRDVRACEYDDVHVMWEILQVNEIELGRSPDKGRRPFWKLAGWARSAPCLGRSF